MSLGIQGEWRWIWVRQVVFKRDADGRVRQVIGTAQDITERKKIKEELENRKEHYRILFDSNPHPMWVYDVDTLEILDVNQQAIENYGYPREEFLAMTLKELRPASEIGHPSKGRIHLKVNGEVRQDGDLTQLIWSVPEIIAQLSTQVALAPGDVIFTGTPAGVGALKPGDELEGEVEGVGTLRVTMGPPEA